MGIEHAEGCRLALEVDETARQHRMLDDVGEVTGVVDMPIIHRPEGRAVRLADMALLNDVFGGIAGGVDRVADVATGAADRVAARGQRQRTDQEKDEGDGPLHDGLRCNDLSALRTSKRRDYPNGCNQPPSDGIHLQEIISLKQPRLFPLLSDVGG